LVQKWLKMVLSLLRGFRAIFEFFFIRSQLAYFIFFLKESGLHEIEKASFHPENSEKGGERYMAQSGRPKKLNNVSTNSHSAFVCVPQSPKTRSQKKTKTSLKTQKQIKNHFTPILNQACAPESYSPIHAVAKLQALVWGCQFAIEGWKRLEGVLYALYLFCRSLLNQGSCKLQYSLINVKRCIRLLQCR